MSILLSSYWRDGIVFSADRNATIIYNTGSVVGQYVEVGAITKVLSWPHRTALVGFIGLGQLAGLRIDEWMRRFVSVNRDFESIDDVAQDLRGLLQADFDKDYPPGADVRRTGAIVHLGGYRSDGGIIVPVAYLITNIPGLLPGPLAQGLYPDATRRFTISDQLPAVMVKWGAAYPSGVREKIGAIEDRGDFLWWNNGYMYPAFNVFKGSLWDALSVLRREAMLPAGATMKDHVAFSEMAVRVFGLFFEQYVLPEERAVGGGADTEWIPWPER
jgi:hypothetical protein